MGVATVQFYTHALGRRTMYDAGLPDLAPKLKGRTDLPVISFDCGVEDKLIDSNRDFHQLLEELEIEHLHVEHPGGHTWEYWDEHIREALPQHETVLGVKREILEW